MRHSFPLLLASALCLPASSRAEDGLSTQREISDMIPQFTSGTFKPEGRKWAVLPEVGYSPDQKLNGGFKFTGRSLTDYAATFDTELNVAMGRQRGADVALLVPKILDGRAIDLDEYHYYLSPDKQFFGLGNNHARTALSYHTIERQRAIMSLAYHLSEDFVAVVSGGWRQTRIARSGLASATPSTFDVFPQLVGINGGNTNPLMLSFVYNNRESITRPTLGWSVIGSIEHVNRNLANDFQFTRYTLDASYLHPLPSRDQVLGLRLGGEILEGPSPSIPFFELPSLGGADDMRGFFPDRFLGRSKMLVSGEYRVKAADFDLRRMWRVKIDGVVFGDAGRVFLTQSDISGPFHEKATLPELFDDNRYDYGFGVRIALGEAILARIDAGFSNEQTALFYLVFGHTF